MKKIFSFFAAMLVAVAVNASGFDFAAPGDSCKADDAKLETVYGLSLVNASESNYIQCAEATYDVTLATWAITATRGCYVSVSLDLGPAYGSNKHIFEVIILNDKGKVQGTLAEDEADSSGSNEKHTESNQLKTLEGTILIPADGEYTVELRSIRKYGKGTIKNIILTYVADAPSSIVDVASVELNKTELTLDLEEVELLTATVLPDDATDPSVTWESDNEAVATVSATGLVKAIAAGTANIKAKAGEKEAVCAVTVAAAAIPEVSFAEPYLLSGKIAHLDGAVWKNDAYQLYGNGGSNKNYGTASWTIHVTKPCVVSGSVNVVDKKSLFVLDLYNADDEENSLGYIAQPYAKRNNKGEIALDSVGHNTLTFPKAGDYTLKLRNTVEWSSGVTAGVTLTFVEDYVVPGEPQVLYLKPGIWYWSGNNEKFAIYAFEDGKEAIWSDYMTLAENETAIWKGTIPAGYTNVIFVRFGKGDKPETPDNWYETIAPDWDNGHVWNQTNDLKIEEGKDLYTITMTTWEGHSGNCPGEWSKYVYVEPAKFSVSGSMTSWTPLEVFANSKTFENLAAGNYEFKIVTPENAWLGLEDLTPEFRQKELYLSGGNIGFTLAEAGNVTITYIKDEVYKVDGNFVLPVVQIRDIDEAAVVLEVAEDKLTASKTVNIKNATNEFKVVIGNNWVGKKNDDGLYGLHRKWNAVSGLTWDGGNIKLTADVIPGEYTFTWTFATGELTVTFPEIPAPKYYLVGDFTEWATNKVLMVEDEGVLSAAYELNAATEYQFKVLKIDYFNNETYIGAENEENQMNYGNSTDWQLTDVDGHNIKLLTTNEASYTFYFIPATYKCSVVIPEAATAVENAEAEMKAVKMIENGQMVIIKNGVRYNVLGAQF